MPEAAGAGRLGREKIVQALRALGYELTQRGVRGQMFVVGGAAMALAYSTRRVTRDIDAVFEPKSAIYEAAAAVAEQLELPEGWLNDAAKAFIPGPDEHALPLPEIEGIEVTAASAEYLLAMKLMAMRIGEDDEDIEVLLDECGIARAEDALALLQRLYPRRDPLPKTKLFLEEMLGEEAGRAD